MKRKSYLILSSIFLKLPECLEKAYIIAANNRYGLYEDLPPNDLSFLVSFSITSPTPDSSSS